MLNSCSGNKIPPGFTVSLPWRETVNPYGFYCGEDRKGGPEAMDRNRQYDKMLDDLEEKKLNIPELSFILNSADSDELLMVLK